LIVSQIFCLLPAMMLGHLFQTTLIFYSEAALQEYQT
jgi:hypothetical protein